MNNECPKCKGNGWAGGVPPKEGGDHCGDYCAACGGTGKIDPWADCPWSKEDEERWSREEGHAFLPGNPGDYGDR